MSFPGSADFDGSVFKDLPGHVYHTGRRPTIHAHGKEICRPDGRFAAGKNVTAGLRQRHYSTGDVRAGAERPWKELSDIQSFYANTPDNPKEFVWIENTKHRYETYSYFQYNPEIMLAWLKRWV